MEHVRLPSLLESLTTWFQDFGVSLVVVSCNDLHRKIPIADWSLKSKRVHAQENETIRVEYLHPRDMFKRTNKG